MLNNFDVPQELIPSDPRFGVGPSLIPREFIESLAEKSMHLLGTSHRKPAVKSLVKEVQEGFREFFHLPNDYEVVIGNGGATFLFDMIGLGLVREKSIHYSMGEFSQKWFKSHSKIPWIDSTNISVEYGQSHKIKDVGGYDMICCTLCETSTGVLINRELPTVSEQTLMAVDATSSAGIVPVDLTKVDLYFFSPQKIFASEGGTYIAFLSPKALKRAEEIAKSNRYIPEIMSWGNAISNSVKNQTYNTPCITSIFYINEQLKTMNELGEEKACELAKEKAAFIYNWAEEHELLSPYVTDKSYRSYTVATIDVDEKYPVDEFLGILRRKKIVYDIEGYRKLGRNQLRISLFHNIKIDDLKKLTKIIDLALSSF